MAISPSRLAINYNKRDSEMKRLIFIATILTSLTFIQVAAQVKEGVKKEGAHEAEYNSDAQDKDGSAEIDTRNQSEDERTGESDAGNQVHDASSAANTAGTDTKTTSASGSPAILMNDSEEADGTNTMQRASLNIAGSPLPGHKKTSSSSTTEDRSENRVMPQTKSAASTNSGAGSSNADRERKGSKNKK
jgi:hypothetical protein